MTFFSATASKAEKKAIFGEICSFLVAFWPFLTFFDPLQKKTIFRKKGDLEIDFRIEKECVPRHRIQAEKAHILFQSKIKFQVTFSYAYEIKKDLNAAPHPSCI